MTVSTNSAAIFQLMQHPIWNLTSRTIGQEASFFVFYCFSGDHFVPDFPNGVDRNLSFKLTAQTLGRMLQLQNSGKVVQVIQSWTKDILFSTLENSKEKIIQVHICAHGDTTWLSMAYHFGNRLQTRRDFLDDPAQSAMTPTQKGNWALRNEDAVVAGYITRILTTAQKTKIKNNHVPNASWQIWGCFSGYPSSVFDSNGTDSYFARFNFGSTFVEGVCVEIAKTFNVKCTGAQGRGGLEFWHGEGRRAVLNGTSTPARLPFWLWLTAPSSWHTFNTTGTETTLPEVLGVDRTAAELTKPAPPQWFVDMYFN